MHRALRRFTVLCVLALALTPVVLILIHRVKTPTLYAGDKVESRACRECGGDGKNHLDGLPPALGKHCLACGGDGSVNVILPGSVRPTRIKGAVADAAKLPPFASYEIFRSRSPVEKPRGTIAGVQVTFRRRDGTVTEIESNPHGFFALRLPPGTYEVSTAAKGYEPLAGELEVPELMHEIWLQEVPITREASSAAEAQSLYGFELLIELRRPGEGRSRLVSCYGTH